MRNTSIRALLLLTLLTACDSSLSTAPGTAGAVVTIVFDGRPADTMRVFVQSQSAIEAARSYIQTQTGPRLLLGKIVRGSGTDTRYPFHFLPDSVSFVDLAIELCDGAPMHTAADVDAFFLGSTGNANAQMATWCPWSSRPIAVEEPASTSR